MMSEQQRKEDRAEIQQQRTDDRAEYRKITRMLISAMLAVAVGFGGLIIIGYAYIQENAHRICDLIVTLDDANRSAPSQPTPNAQQKKITDEIHRFRVNNGC